MGKKNVCNSLLWFSKKELAKLVKKSGQSPQPGEPLEEFCKKIVVNHLGGYERESSHSMKDSHQEGTLSGFDYPWCRYFDMQILKKIKEIVDSQGEKAAILEIGGGIGRLTAKASLTGAKNLHFNDANLDAVTFFKEKVWFKYSNNPLPTIIQGSFETIPTQRADLKNSFDFIYSRSMMHFLSPIQAKEFVKVTGEMLKCGGTAMIDAQFLLFSHGSKECTLYKEKKQNNPSELVYIEQTVVYEDGRVKRHETNGYAKEQKYTISCNGGDFSVPEQQHPCKSGDYKVKAQRLLLDPESLTKLFEDNGLKVLSSQLASCEGAVPPSQLSGELKVRDYCTELPGYPGPRGESFDINVAVVVEKICLAGNEAGEDL
jgi:SAM-dependent methyltransferase